jgi:HEAT repeat protein
VRLRALEALSGASQDPNVRTALIEVLTHDNNPGVRIEAINSMRSLVDAGAAAGDDRVRTLLEKLSERDANNYVRLQAAAAVRRMDSGNQP